MSKLDALKRGVGDNVSESMGVGRPRLSHGETLPLSPGLPAKLQGIKKPSDAALIPVSRIQPDPDQPREEFDDEALNRLADSLKAHGQLQPIRVRWNDQLESYVILCGERRWRAAVKAGLEMMQCVIQAGVLTAAELLGLQIVENLLREDLRPIEEAKAYHSLMKLNGWSARELARELAIHHASVARAIALLDLPASVQDQVEQGALSPSVAYEVSRLGDEETIKAVAAEVTASELTRAETVERVRQVAKARGTKGKGRGGKPKPLKSRTVRTSGAKVTVDLRKAGDAAAILEALREAVRQVESEMEGSESAAA